MFITNKLSIRAIFFMAHNKYSKSIAVIFALSLLGHQAFAEQRCPNIAATLESLEGKVEWKSIEQQEWLNANAGSTFCYGDKIRVTQYRAALRLANDTVVRLNQNSLLHLIPPQKGFWVELVEGAAHFLSRTPKAFEVKAPYLNAAVDGTEFIVTAVDNQNQVSVIEGKVTVSNTQGALELVNSQQSTTYRNGAPKPAITINLKDSAQWVLYYPALFATNSTTVEVQQLIADNQYALALTKLKSTTTAEQLSLAASLNLALGNSNAAQQLLTQALAITPTSADAKAVNAFMALTQQGLNTAISISEQLIQQHPNNINALLAHSYILQGQGKLTQALEHAERAHKIATASAPNAPLSLLSTKVRYAELLLNNNYNRKAKGLINQALSIAPNHSQLHNLAGFIALNMLDGDTANNHFTQAVNADSNNALAHFGLAMSSIQSGDINAGQQSMELAVLLDPSNSLYRSYLGKTYFEQHEIEWAKTQYTLAKQLDPNDPTPWFYEAHLLQQQGRLQETLINLETSKQLNDNRAVYRSRLFLDNDIAAKNANQTNVYLDLNIEQVAKAQAGLAATQNHGEFANHRALSLAYRQDNNAQVLQKNEATLTRILQPIGAKALPIGVGQPAIVTYGWLSPGEIGTNEYSSLYTTRGISGSITDYGGTQNSNGFDWQTQAIGQAISASVGQYKYGSDGFAENNDFDINYREANIHFQPTQGLKVMAHLNTSKLATGDITQAIDSEAYDPNFRKSEKTDEKVLGIKLQASPNDLILGIYSEQEISGNISTEFSPFPGLLIESFIERETKQVRQEVQWLKGFSNANLTLGHSSEEVMTIATPQAAAFNPALKLLDTIVDTQHSTSYFRLSSNIQNIFEYLLGAGNVKWSNATRQKDSEQLNYELGGLLHIKPGLNISIAKWRKVSEHTPSIGSLGNNFIYAINTSNNNSAFNLTESNALNITWSPNFSTFIYDIRKSKNSDNVATTGSGIDATNNQTHQHSADELKQLLSWNVPISKTTSMSLSHQYIKAEKPITLITDSQSPLNLKNQKISASVSQQILERLSIEIEWSHFKQRQGFADASTSSQLNVEESITRENSSQTNISINYRSQKAFKLLLKAHNIFNDRTAIKGDDIQRNTQLVLPIPSNTPPERSVSMSINYSF